MVLEVITPDEQLFKGKVNHVVLPGADGSFGVLSNHAPLIAILTAGEIKVTRQLDNSNSTRKDEAQGKYNSMHADESEFTFPVKGGIVEVKENKVVVLAE